MTEIGQFIVSVIRTIERRVGGSGQRVDSSVRILVSSRVQRIRVLEVPQLGRVVTLVNSGGIERTNCGKEERTKDQRKKS